MRYQLAILDFDGTLADSFPWFAAQFNTLARRFGLRTLDAQQLEQLRGLHTRQLMATVGLPLWRLPAVLRHVRREIARDAHTIALFEGIAPALAKLHGQGVQLAIASSNSEATIRQVLGPSLAGLIGHYRCGASMFGKQAHFRRLLQQTGVPAARALCIGDELRDAEAATAAGIDFAAVSWGYAPAEVLAPRARHLLGEPAAMVALFD